MLYPLYSNRPLPKYLLLFPCKSETLQLPEVACFTVHFRPGGEADTPPLGKLVARLLAGLPAESPECKQQIQLPQARCSSNEPGCFASSNLDFGAPILH